MIDLSSLVFVLLTFFLAGGVKGVIGLGLPTLSLGLLAASLELPTAMVLLILPSLATNLWQAIVGGHALLIIRRLWPFLLMATLGIAIGGLALVHVPLSLLSGLLGLVLVVYGLVGLGGVRIEIPARHEPWAGPVFGSVNGVLTGMTGSFVVPGVLYLQSIGLSRDVLIQAMGMLFSLSTMGLAVILHQGAFLETGLAVVSALAVAPALAGMMVGQWVRRHLSEAVFRRLFFAALVLLGSYITLSAMSAFG